MRARVVRSSSYPLRTLGKLLRPVANQRRRTAGELARYSLMLGMSHMVLIKEVAGREKLDLIAVHGQTVYHEARVTLQLMNVHPIVQEMRAPVLFDLRGSDLSAGGQGAPITPLADHVLFRDTKETRVVLNLGGFCNFTWLPPTRHSGKAAIASIRGGDICACNQVLDTIARRIFRKKYDRGGKHALAGRIDPEARRFLLQMLEVQANGRRSLGTGDEAADWVRCYADSRTGEDLARTACSVIAQVIGQTLGQVDRVILAGGSALNKALVAEIQSQFDAPVSLSDEFGVPVQYREAVCMAVLGALAADKVPITLPQVTGRTDDAPVGGCWAYP